MHTWDDFEFLLLLLLHIKFALRAIQSFVITKDNAEILSE